METKQSSAQRTTIRNVRGSELPEAWARQAGIAPDQEIDIVIQDRQAAMRRLTRLMDELGEHAHRHGLTEQTLETLLQDIDDERRRERATD